MLGAILGGGAALGKALTALRAGGAAVKLAKAGKAAGTALGKVGASKGVQRFAGNKLSKMARGLTPGGFAKNLGVPMTKSDIAMTVAPDLLFGGMAAAMTPGDIGDKAIAGLGSAVGGVAGGLGTRGLLGPKSGLGILGSEMVGGMVGDQVGMGVADSIIRAKNGGMTPMEQQAQAADEAYRRQLYDQFMAENGLA